MACIMKMISVQVRTARASSSSSEVEEIALPVLVGLAIREIHLFDLLQVFCL